MVAQRRMLTIIRVVAVVIFMAGAALLGHGGIHAARAATTADTPPGPVIAVPADKDCDKDNDSNKDSDKDTDKDSEKSDSSDKDKADTDVAKPSVDTGTAPSAGSASPAEKDSDEDKSDDTDKIDDDTCGVSGGVSAPAPVVPVPAPVAAPAPPAASAPATGGVKAAAGKAPVTAVPKTGAEVPIGAGLILTAAGLGALAGGRRLRRKG